MIIWNEYKDRIILYFKNNKYVKNLSLNLRSHLILHSSNLSQKPTYPVLHKNLPHRIKRYNQKYN